MVFFLIPPFLFNATTLDTMFLSMALCLRVHDGAVCVQTDERTITFRDALKCGDSAAVAQCLTSDFSANAANDVVNERLSDGDTPLADASRRGLLEVRMCARCKERTEGWLVEVVPQAGEGGCPIELDAYVAWITRWPGPGVTGLALCEKVRSLGP
jgi:hypothetical protein